MIIVVVVFDPVTLPPVLLSALSLVLVTVTLVSEELVLAGRGLWKMTSLNQLCVVGGLGTGVGTVESVWGAVVLTSSTFLPELSGFDSIVDALSWPAFRYPDLKIVFVKLLSPCHEKEPLGMANPPTQMKTEYQLTIRLDC